MSVVSNDAPATPLGRARAHTVQAHGVVEVNRQALGALEDAEPPEGGHAGESEVEVGQRGVLLRVHPIRTWTYTSIHSELTYLVRVRGLEDTAVVGDVRPLYLRGKRRRGVENKGVDLVLCAERDVASEAECGLVCDLPADVEEPDVGVVGLVPP